MHYFLLGFRRRHRRSSATFHGDVENKLGEPGTHADPAIRNRRTRAVHCRVCPRHRDSLSTDKITATVEKRLPQLTNEIVLRTTEMAKLLAASVPLEYLHYMRSLCRRFVMNFRRGIII